MMRERRAASAAAIRELSAATPRRFCRAMPALLPAPSAAEYADADTSG